MREQEASRQLVKSRPELWAQCSDAERLTRHLHNFGELRITRLEPESTVAWEGETVSGTVTLEASGWGTRVRLTALATEDSGAPAAGLAAPRATVSAPPLVLASRSLTERFSAFLSRRGAPLPAARPAPESGAPKLRPAEPAPTDPHGGDLVAELEAALDSLGQAHHRPYSRA